MAGKIEVEHLTRTFGQITAVDDISFSMHRGDVLGFLGPNGAGKSTTMKMLASFLTPTSGTARICGHDVQSTSREARKSLGYLPESAPLYGEMTVRDFLRFIASVREIPAKDESRVIGRTVELAHLGEVMDQRIETLSKGFKRRVGLAQALIHDPEVLILDEPTDGLDPNQKHDVRELIREMAQHKCILLSTHILEEVDEVCNRVIIISDGRLLVDEKPHDLRTRSKHYGAVRLTFEGATPAEVVDRIRGIPTVSSVEIEKAVENAETIVALAVPGKEIFRDVYTAVEQNGWPVSRLSVHQGELDDVFREVTGGVNC